MNSASGRQPTAVTVLPCVYPLDDVYARDGRPLPRIETVDESQMPEPFRALLVHNRDVAFTLEEYFGVSLHLVVLRREERGTFYFREAVMHLDRDDRPVGFGAAKIGLSLFTPAARRLVLEERLPLGHILEQCNVTYHGTPKAFFRIQSDPTLNRAFCLSCSQTLYGRQNTIWDPQQRPLSQVVEILPPLPATEPQ